jgi:hypothetical protein
MQLSLPNDAISYLIIGVMTAMKGKYRCLRVWRCEGFLEEVTFAQITG